MKVRVEKQIGKQVLALETGWLAKQAAGAVVAQYADTLVLTAVASGPGRPGQDFFPLTCDYRERTAAAGKFPGGFIKREGRPTIKETLTSRLMDRPIRPLFPEGFVDEVQVQAMVMSSDRQHDADVVAMNGAAAALFVSPLPFRGPIASVRLGRIEGEFVPFPTADELEGSDLDLIVSGSEQAVMMIEGFAREMPEDDMVQAILTAHGYIREICALQRELAEKLNVQKMAWEAPADSGLFDRLKARFYDEFRTAKQTPGKQARADAVRQLKERALAEFLGADAGGSPGATSAGSEATTSAVDPVELDTAWHKLEYRIVRDLILAGTRPDGRDAKTLRDIECHVDVLPRTHGSAVFQRGETQALITVTLGTAKDEQRVDGLMEEYSKKFMLDYNFPSFSVGECRPIRGPGRREIGHGALAERSVKPVVPPPDDFPYTIRVISDILESNGSSSMASVCGATLGLMAAGVPITNPVAGISIGLVKESEDRWITLTDIIGDEDHYGDMDFKIAGTQNGITGIQLDLKIDGISEAIIRQTLTQARETRIEILRKILMTIREPRTEISAWAPRLIQTKIEVDKIGLLIGPGGKTVRGIQESTGTVVEIAEDGTVTIASANREWAEKALAQIEALTATVQIGKIYDGRVTSIKDFGAFVEILPGRDGLCHISELSNGFVNSVSDVCKVGDDMKVIVIDIDEHDRVKLSRRRALEQLGLPDTMATGEAGERPERSEREPRGDSRRREGRGRNGDGRRDRDRDRDRR
ncbi:MAG: polyribonucleotide nucleotidyltransferase [Pirellulaceae bacterium]